MNLTQLKKEVFLLEHGFYDDEIIRWYHKQMKSPTEAEQAGIIRLCIPRDLEAIRRAWFKSEHPDLFDKVKK